MHPVGCCVRTDMKHDISFSNAEQKPNMGAGVPFISASLI